MMKEFYVVAEGQPNDRAVYYTGKEAFHGGELWGNIDDAYRFESKEEVIQFLMRRDFCCARFIIVEIPDCTWNVIEQGYKDLCAGKESEERVVYHKYNTISYITNSGKED